MSDEQKDTRSPEQIEADIQATRARLTNTVDELSYRVDPRIKVEEAKVRANQLAGEAKASGQRFVAQVKSGDPKALGIVGGAVALGLLAVIAGIRTDD